MRDYDFKILSPDEFEDLARQLLSKVYFRDVRFGHNSFASSPKGKDKGIDLYYSTENNDFDIVVQVKHYADSPVSNLKSTLFGNLKGKLSELDKVKKICPNRYILVTSANLTLSDKQLIKSKFKPYIRVLKDIIDCKQLNNLLEDYPDVERRFVKLYFTSAEIMRQVIGGISVGYGEFLASRIENKIKVYVDTGSFYEAEKILLSNKVLIITGEPGSGKTTLAEILVYKYLKEKYQLGYILNDIGKVDSLWTDSPQIFYYDDFLGQNSYESEFAQKEERPLQYFIERIKKSKNKLFVLTTRTIIYNHARNISQRIRDVQNEAKVFQLEVKKLSHENKVFMVKNHLDYKAIPLTLRSEITEYEITQIAEHPNFYPRLIDFVTDKLSLEYIFESKCSFYTYIIETLGNPNEIWRICYERQIDEAERIFLNTIFSIGNNIGISNARLAFERRLTFEYNRPDCIVGPWVSFDDCFRSLNEAFILTGFNVSGERLVSFINPSVVDFLVSYLARYGSQCHRIIEASYFVEQFYIRFRSLTYPATKSHINVSLSPSFLAILVGANPKIATIHEFVSLEERANYLNLFKAFVLIMYFEQDANFEEHFSFLIRSVDFAAIENVHFNNIYNLLFFLSARENYYSLVHENWVNLIALLIDTAGEFDDLKRIFILFDKFGLSISEFFSCEEHVSWVRDFILWNKEPDVAEVIEELKVNAKSMGHVNAEKQKLLEEIRKDFEECYLSSDIDELRQWREVDWDRVIEDNLERDLEFYSFDFLDND